MPAEDLRTACIPVPEVRLDEVDAATVQVVRPQRKGMLGYISLASLVGCFAGFAPALALYLERGCWKLDAFYMANESEPLDRWVLGWHAPLGYLWLAIAVLQVCIGAGFLPWKRLHRYMGYTVAAPLAVVLTALGARKEFDAWGVPACFHLAIGTASMVNLAFAIRYGMAKRYRDHAEFAGYFVIIVTQPGWTRFAGFMSEFWVPCGLNVFDGYEFVMHMLVAAALQIVMCLRGGSRHRWGLVGNTAYLLLHGLANLIYTTYSGTFFRCQEPVSPVWRWR